MMLAITGLLIGALLGLRIKVLILVPATVVYTGAIFWVGLAHHQSVVSVVLATVTAITTLQLGYVCGTIGCCDQQSINAPPGKRPQQTETLSA